MFTIINNDDLDPVTGRFFGLPQGGNITSQPAGGTQPQNFTINYSGGTGNDVVLTAQAVATTSTTTTLTSSLNPSQAGNSVTITATVTPNTGSATPTGTVTFLDLGSGGTPTELATVPLNSAGVATFTLTNLALGTHILIASYNGGGVFASSSGDLEQDVTTPVPALDGRALALLAVALAAIGTFLLRGE